MVNGNGGPEKREMELDYDWGCKTWPPVLVIFSLSSPIDNGNLGFSFGTAVGAS